MKNNTTNSPRCFDASGVTIKDFGKLELNNNDMISFKTKSNKEYDFVAKDWGFYATPSINSRLQKEGFKTSIVVNKFNRVFIMVVEDDKIEEFKKYLKDQRDHKIICWLDDWFKEES